MQQLTPEPCYTLLAADDFWKSTSLWSRLSCHVTKVSQARLKNDHLMLGVVFDNAEPLPGCHYCDFFLDEFQAADT